MHLVVQGQFPRTPGPIHRVPKSSIRKKKETMHVWTCLSHQGPSMIRHMVARKPGRHIRTHELHRRALERFVHLRLDLWACKIALNDGCIGDRFHGQNVDRDHMPGFGCSHLGPASRRSSAIHHDMARTDQPVLFVHLQKLECASGSVMLRFGCFHIRIACLALNPGFWRRRITTSDKQEKHAAISVTCPAPTLKRGARVQKRALSLSLSLCGVDRQPFRMFMSHAAALATTLLCPEHTGNNWSIRRWQECPAVIIHSHKDSANNNNSTSTACDRQQQDEWQRVWEIPGNFARSDQCLQWRLGVHASTALLHRSTLPAAILMEGGTALLVNTAETLRAWTPNRCSHYENCFGGKLDESSAPSGKSIYDDLSVVVTKEKDAENWTGTIQFIGAFLDNEAQWERVQIPPHSNPLPT